MPAPAPQRADARRNREKILDAARAALAEAGGRASMAEISRRAGVGMGTLYRHFPERRDVLEALYVGEVDALCAAAEEPPGATPGATLDAWLLRFAAFFESKHDIATELLQSTDGEDPLFTGGRARVLQAGRPLLEAAQAAGDVKPGLTLEQVLDLVLAVAKIRGDAAYREPILSAALAGLRAA